MKRRPGVPCRAANPGRTGRPSVDPARDLNVRAVRTASLVFTANCGAQYPRYPDAVRYRSYPDPTRYPRTLPGTGVAQYPENWPMQQ